MSLATARSVDSEFRTVKLGDIADLQAGFGFPPLLQGRVEGEIPFAKVGDISAAAKRGSGPLTTARNYVSRDELASLRARVVPVGSTLFAKIGEAISQNFRVVSGTELLIDNNSMAAIPLGNVDSRFLYRFLQTVNMYQLASTTSVPSLRKSDLERIDVPLPPLPEQRRIAAILDHADETRAKRRRTLDVMEQAARAVMAKVLGSSVLRSTDLGDLVEEFRYGTSEKSGPTGVPVLRIPNVSKRELDLAQMKYVQLGDNEANRLMLRDNDLLIVRSNGNPDIVGATVRFENPDKLGPYVFASYLIRARLAAGCDSIFVERYLHSDEGRAALRRGARTSAGQYNINTKALAAISIPLPPIDIQHSFAQKVRSLDALKSAHVAHLAKLDELFASLQHRAFTGQL